MAWQDLNSLPDVGGAVASVPQQPQNAAPGGLRGLLLKALPIIGGGAGAALGTVVGPAGTLAGGAVGSGLGEFLRQKLSGEQTNVGTIAREGAFGAVPGVFRAAKAATGAVRASGGARGAINATIKQPQTTEAVMQTRKGLVDRAKGNAQTASQQGFGLTVGQSAGRGKVLTPDKADELQDFITNRSQQYGGIRAGKPIDQARDAQKVLGGVTKSLDDTLTKIDRKLEVQEQASVVARALEIAKNNAAITKATPTLEKFKSKIEKATSLKELEAIRREADDLAFTSTGAGKTSAAAQSHAVRDAIDEFITPLSADYKAIKGDYTLARDALNYTSKASKDAKGFPVPFTGGGVQVGAQALSGAKNKAAAKIANSSAAGGQPAQPSFRPFMGTAKAAIPQAATRVAGSTLFGTPFVGTSQPPEQTEVPVDPQLGLPPEMPQAQPTQTYSPENLMADIQRDPQNASEYIKIFEGLQKATGATGTAIKKTEAQRARDEAAALTDDALAQLQSGSVNTGFIASPFEDFKSRYFNAGDPETIDFNTTVDALKAAIAKARAGTSFTPNEEKLLNKYAPKSGDSMQQLMTKLQNLQVIYRQAAEREYGTQYTEPAAAQVPA